MLARVRSCRIIFMFLSRMEDSRWLTKSLTMSVSSFLMTQMSLFYNLKTRQSPVFVCDHLTGVNGISI